MGTDLAVAFIVASMVAAAAAGWWLFAPRHVPQHKAAAGGPRHAAVSVPRAGSMCLDAEQQLRGSDGARLAPADWDQRLGRPWTAPPPGAAQIITSAALEDPAQDWLDPLLTRLLHTTGEIMSGKLLAEVTSELDRQDRDTAEFLSQLAADIALARLQVLGGWA